MKYYGKQYTNYKAANITGAEVSIILSDKFENVIKRNLPIDRHDVYIVVREDLKEHLIKKGFPFLQFYGMFNKSKTELENVLAEYCRIFSYENANDHSGHDSWAVTAYGFGSAALSDIVGKIK
jgi:hypothetical protein